MYCSLENELKYLNWSIHGSNYAHWMYQVPKCSRLKILLTGCCLMLEAPNHSNNHRLRKWYNLCVFVEFGLIVFSIVIFDYRSDAAHFLRPRRMPLGSVDSEDGNALVDDELNTLLPGTREVSADDLSQVLIIPLNLNWIYRKVCKASGNIAQSMRRETLLLKHK